MFPYQGLFSLVTIFIMGCVLWMTPLVARAQEPEPETSENEKTPASVAPADPQQEGQTVQPIPLEEVPNRAESTIAELNSLRPRETSRRVLERLSLEANLTLREVDSQLAKTRQTLAGQPNVRALQKSEVKLSTMLTQLRSLGDQLEQQLEVPRTTLERIDRISAVWTATDHLAQSQEGVDATTLTRIATVRGEVEKARSAAVERRNQILAVRDKLVNPSVALSESVDQLQGQIGERLESIFEVDHPSMWSPLVWDSLNIEWQTDPPQQFLKQFRENWQQTLNRPQMLGFQFVLFVAFSMIFRWLHGRDRSKGDDDCSRHAELVLEHPWAMGVLMTAVFTVPIQPFAPRSAGVLAAAFIAAATLRIVLRFLPPVMAPLAWGLAVLFILDRARDTLDTTPTFERFFFHGELVGGLGLMLWLLRPTRIAGLLEKWQRHPFVRLLNTAMRTGAALLMLAILADLAGWSDLAVLLGDGVLRSSFLGLLIFVQLKVFHGLTTLALGLQPLRLIRAISIHRQIVENGLERILNVLAVCLWGALVCGQLGLLDPATSFVKKIIAADVTVGALTVSVADVLVFVITVWLSFLLARLVHVLLQEDVFTRVRTGRGVPYAVSNLARYSVIFVGFMVGLSAAGIEITNLAVVAGGLGVGIGFGLQNIVNNFVSGLILLFERPIDVGDSIEFSDTTGTMQRIGIRASVIRTFDGAEVIVPNGMLISDSVTNWTLSDRRRRIDLDVGVEYGTPAQRVIDLLVEVAKANPKVIPIPEPCAYFDNFGDSSLDFKLRVWFSATSSTNIHTIRSEIAVAVQKALDEADIEVPFPQRDVRIINVPDNVSDLSPEIPLPDLREEPNR